MIDEELYVPFVPKPSGANAAITQILDLLGEKIDPRSGHFWVYNLRDQVPANLHSLFGPYGEDVFAPINFPGVTESQPTDSDFMGDEFRQIRPGLVMSKKMAEYLSLDSKLYEPPRTLDIISPRTMVDCPKYFGVPVTKEIEARVAAGRIR